MTTNYYNKIDKKDDVLNPNLDSHHVFELPCRWHIVGHTGTGKTNIALNIINRLGEAFYKIVLITKVADEPLYRMLKEKLKDNMKIYDGNIIGGKGKKVPNIPDVDDVAEKDDKGWIPTLVIFDDCCLDKNQEKIGEYFIRGRKKNLSCMYLSQAYYMTPKAAVRTQCDYTLLLAGMATRDLNCILRELPTKLNKRELVDTYEHATTKFGDFLLMSKKGGKLYKSFSLQDIGSTEKEIQSVVLKKAEKKTGRKVNTIRDCQRDVCIQFKNLLLENQAELENVVPMRDLHVTFKDWCKKNGYISTASKRMLGGVLNKVFRTYQGTNGIEYVLNENC